MHEIAPAADIFVQGPFSFFSGEGKKLFAIQNLKFLPLISTVCWSRLFYEPRVIHLQPPTKEKSILLHVLH